MEKQTIGLIYEKIPKIMGLVGVVGKDKTNTMQGYKFRGIDDMYNALNQHLTVEKVFITSKILDVKREERTSKQGGALIYSILTMEFQFFAEDGSSVTSITIGEAMDSGDKSMNKAMSTAYKYALMQIFCIPTEEDKDTENQTHEVAAKFSPKSTPTASTPNQNGGIKNIGKPVVWNDIKWQRIMGISKKTGNPYDMYVDTNPNKDDQADPINPDQMASNLRNQERDESDVSITDDMDRAIDKE